MKTIMQSHPARGAWIEIALKLLKRHIWQSRTPQGVRGLKCMGRRLANMSSKSHPARGAWIEMISSSIRRLKYLSHPARGAWIEITRTALCLRFKWSHPARGAWIEMPISASNPALSSCRTPQGVRGLKSGMLHTFPGINPSHPARGAWIEI